MQYVGQTKRALKTRFKEHVFKIKKKRRKNINILYKQFRRAGLVKFWYNKLKKLYTSPNLPKDSTIF